MEKGLKLYVIKGKRGSGTICLNGPAARKAMAGDIVVIISYADSWWNKNTSAWWMVLKGNLFVEVNLRER